jgi:hypothetical protein
MSQSVCASDAERNEKKRRWYGLQKPRMEFRSLTKRRTLEDGDTISVQTGSVSGWHRKRINGSSPWDRWNRRFSPTRPVSFNERFHQEEEEEWRRLKSSILHAK